MAGVQGGLLCWVAVRTVDAEAVQRVTDQAARPGSGAGTQVVEMVLPADLRMPMAGVLKLMRRGVASLRVQGTVQRRAGQRDADHAHPQAAGPDGHLRLSGQVQHLRLWPDSVRIAVVAEGVVTGRDGEDAGGMIGQVVEGVLSPTATGGQVNAGGRPAHGTAHHRFSPRPPAVALYPGSSLQRPDVQPCRRTGVHRSQSRLVRDVSVTQGQRPA